MSPESLKEQGDTIRFIVNTSPDKETAQDRYSSLVGIDLPEAVADDIFTTTLNAKFPPIPDKTAQALELIERVLRNQPRRNDNC